MIYFLELEDLRTRQVRSLEAASDSPLEELSARIKVAFDYDYYDYDDHEFCFLGHKYVPAHMVDRVCEFSFETWDPEDPREEPNWREMYRSSDDITLEDAFTTIGSSINYEQRYHRVRITLVDREDDESSESHFDSYDYIQDEFDK